MVNILAVCLHECPASGTICVRPIGCGGYQMKEQLKALYEMQKLDIRIQQINARLAAMNNARAYRKQYAVAKGAFDNSEKQLQAFELELKDVELTLKTVDEKRTKQEKRLYSGSISNPKELSAVEKEIQSLKSQQSELDGKALALYDSIENSKKDVESARERLDKTEHAARKAMKAEMVEKKQLEAELAELTPKRNDTAAKVTNKQILSRYEAIRKRTNSTAIAKVVDHKCGECHVGMASFMIKALHEGKELISCENCGRMLFMDMSNE
jgi:predicted  nucleic acid-binding Zn-ribbon protein